MRKFKRCACVLAALMAASAAGAQDEKTIRKKDLSSLSIEDLMQVQVTSVSKKEQKLSRTAAAVFVITEEDIRRSGATNIPDLLHMVPGMDVGEINGSTWAVSARGFNSQFSNKLLVMIDGRIIYTPTFAGVFWDTLDLPLEDIERIEVIRGPGGAVWGVNAVNGVVSIFTKDAAETKGGTFVAGGGNLEHGFGLAQYGGTLRKDTSYRVYAKYFNQNHMLDLAGQNGADGWHAFRTGFRIDSVPSSNNSLTFEGDLSLGREGEMGFVLPSVTSPGFVAVSEQIGLADGSGEFVWKHAFSVRSDTTLQISFDRHVRDDPQNPETRDTWDLDFQHHVAWGERQDIVWGLGYRVTPDRIEGGLTVSMNPVSRTLQVFNTFVQDEIMLVPDRVYLTVGTKLEHNDYTGFEIMPDVRATWSPSDHHMFWAAISRDLRAPSRNDTNLVLNAGTGPAGPPDLIRLLGNPNFQDEKLIAYEAGYRRTLSGRLSVDLASYYNDYDNLQTTEPLAPFSETTPPPPHEVIPFTYENLMYGETHGGEVAANWKVTDRWTLSPGYAVEQLHMHTKPPSVDTQTGPFVEGAAPRHSAQLRSHIDLRNGLAWNASAYFVDRLYHQGSSGAVAIPAYTRVDTGLTWKLGEGFSIDVVGQNIAQDHHIEFDDMNGSMQSGEIKRSAYGKISWHF